MTIIIDILIHLKQQKTSIEILKTTRHVNEYKTHTAAL